MIGNATANIAFRIMGLIEVTKITEMKAVVALPIATNTALRLSRYFSLSERFWINLQVRYELETEKDRLGERIEKEVLVEKADFFEASAADEHA